MSGCSVVDVKDEVLVNMISVVWKFCIDRESIYIRQDAVPTAGRRLLNLAICTDFSCL